MSEPHFHYEALNQDGTRSTVHEGAPGAARETWRYLGIVYETAGAGWVADWGTRGHVAMPGFKDSDDAAGALYWFAPPAQSFGSRPAGRTASRMDEQPDTEESYRVRPSLIPHPGVLVSLMPMRGGGDFLVDCNTWGVGSGIGYLERHEDGQFDVRIDDKVIGETESPEAGMWAVLKDFTGSGSYERLLADFTPSGKGNLMSEHDIVDVRKLPPYYKADLNHLLPLEQSLHGRHELIIGDITRYRAGIEYYAPIAPTEDGRPRGGTLTLSEKQARHVYAQLGELFKRWDLENEREAEWSSRPHFSAWMTYGTGHLSQPHMDVSVWQDKLTGEHPGDERAWSPDYDTPAAFSERTTIAAEGGDIEGGKREAERLLNDAGWRVIGEWRDADDMALIVSVARTED
ncbi:hypothetical protein [Streptomyces sp. NBC_01538]|uniref:hypothetical protein n=1 Tax=Streptomyces sp. NBC_01538 TaxID=2903897 RepID=UPI0038631F03